MHNLTPKNQTASNIQYLIAHLLKTLSLVPWPILDVTLLNWPYRLSLPPSVTATEYQWDRRFKSNNHPNRTEWSSITNTLTISDREQRCRPLERQPELGKGQGRRVEQRKSLTSGTSVKDKMNLWVRLWQSQASSHCFGHIASAQIVWITPVSGASVKRDKNFRLVPAGKKCHQDKQARGVGQ